MTIFSERDLRYLRSEANEIAKGELGLLRKTQGIINDSHDNLYKIDLSCSRGAGPGEKWKAAGAIIMAVSALKTKRVIMSICPVVEEPPENRGVNPSYFIIGRGTDVYKIIFWTAPSNPGINIPLDGLRRAFRLPWLEIGADFWHIPTKPLSFEERTVLADILSPMPGTNRPDAFSLITKMNGLSFMARMVGCPLAEGGAVYLPFANERELLNSVRASTDKKMGKIRNLREHSNQVVNGNHETELAIALTSDRITGGILRIFTKIFENRTLTKDEKVG